MDPLFYGLDGQPISVEEAENLLPDIDARRVAYDNLPDGRAVSTVFLVLDHSLMKGPPVLYETILFDAEGAPQRTQRYSTREEALQGHREMVWQALAE